MNRTHGKAVTSLLAVSLFALCGIAAAADSPSKLRSEMTKVEKEYVELYNKLNTDHQFDIICVMQQPTGTRFPVRVCQPRFLVDSTATAASERMQSAVSASASASPANAAGPNVGVAATGGATSGQADKQQAFVQNILAVQQKSPELQALGAKRDELQARYAEATKGK